MRPLITRAAPLLVGLSVLVSVAGCTSSSGGEHSSSRPPATTSSSPLPATTETAPAGTAAQVQQWYEGVSTHFATIQTDTEAIKSAAQTQKASDLPNLCGALQVHVAAAFSDPAAPLKTLATAISSALGAYARAATSCLAGDYNTAATGINQGASYLTQANAIINSLS